MILAPQTQKEVFLSIIPQPRQLYSVLRTYLAFLLLTREEMAKAKSAGGSMPPKLQVADSQLVCPIVGPWEPSSEQLTTFIRMSFIIWEQSCSFWEWERFSRAIPWLTVGFVGGPVGSLSGGGDRDHLSFNYNLGVS